MKLSRRGFLKASAALSAASLSSPSFSQGKISNDSDPSFQALVGVFLLGGNDAYNTVVPLGGQAYQDYQNARPSLAIPSESLLPTGLTTDNGVELGLHPAMLALLPHFTEHKNANIVVNSGQLLTPVVGFNPKHTPLPPFLMAHNQQQKLCQLGAANIKSGFGWAGQVADEMQLSAALPPLMSVHGNKIWLQSEDNSPFVIEAKGGMPYVGTNVGSRLNALTEHFDRDYASVFTETYNATAKNHYLNNNKVKALFDATPSFSGFPKSSLGQQLNTVARLIRTRAKLGHRKQIYLVGLGGFDTHNDQVNRHFELLSTLSEAINAFLTHLMAEGLSNNVTTFTMSDFGRRLIANASGTDHGWGGHQFVFNGNIQQDHAIGTWPDFSGEQYLYKKGRVIPEIATDQVNESLLRWFGYTGNTHRLFPNLDNFSPLSLYQSSI